MFLKACGIAAAVVASSFAAVPRPAATGKPGLTAAPCPDQAWEEDDATFDALPQARGPYEEAIPFDGRIERPVLTLHGSGDLYVPISLEQALRRAVDEAGKSSLLVQRVVRSPGHCNFSAREQTDAFDALVSWARNGSRPDGDEVLGDLTDAGRKFTNPLRPGDPGMRRISALARERH